LNNYDKEKKFISIVVYLNNSEDTIKKFYSIIDEFFSYKFESFEYIFVNNACEDSTVSILNELAENTKGDTKITNLAWLHDKETAMQAGIDLAIGDYIFEFESTLIDFDIGEIWAVYNKCLEGYDIVAASSKNPLSFSSRLFYKFLNRVTYRKMELQTETFRIVSRRALNRISVSKELVRYRKALYHYSGFKTTTVYYVPTSKTNTQNNDISIKEKFSLASNILITYSNIGTKIAGILSFTFFILTLFVMAYTILSYLLKNNIEPGWTTLMLFLSLSFSGMFFILAIISKYLNIILLEVQHKPRYMYSSLDRITKN
jgi:polyisoprenyl-phosphate glycosyltransferase